MVSLTPARPSAGQSPGPASSAQLLPTVALTVTAALGSLMVLIAAAFLLHPSTHYSGLFAYLGDQNQSVKTALYLAAFLIVLPISLVAVPRLTDVVASGPNAGGLGILAAGLGLGLTLAIVLARVSYLFPWGNGVAVVLVAGCCWWLVAAAALARAISSRPWAGLLRAARFAPALAVGAAAGAVGSLLCVTTLPRLSSTALALGALAAVAALLVYRRARLPAPGGAGGLLLDLLIVVILLLAIPDLAIFKPARTPGATHFYGFIIEDQENYLLGPANQVLHGGAMLVDTISQYGVGLIYFLAAWLHLAPIGYGTLGFLDGLLTALLYVAAYWLLRLAAVPRLLAFGGLALGVVALLYNLTYPVGALAEHGPLRFGLPLAAIVAAAAGVSLPRYSRPARWVTLGLIALASVWSLEAFAYTVISLAAMAGVRVLALSPGSRRSWLLRAAATSAIAVVAVQLLFAGATLAATGELPDWGQYFAYFHAFLFGSVANLSYGFARWSPGLAVGALYLASAISLVLAIWRAPAMLGREARSLIALAGTTAYGIALFSYFDNRSATYLLLYVALPALLTAVIWLSLLLRLAGQYRPSARSWVLAPALATAVVVLAAAWAPIAGRFSDSALGHVVEQSPSPGRALHVLWHPPPLDPRAPVGQLLLARYMPDQRRSAVLMVVTPDLATEILIRSGRGNRLPLGDPVEDSIVPTARIPVLTRAIAKLHSGDRLLINQQAVAYLKRVHGQVPANLLTGSDPEMGPVLEEWCLAQIAHRFRLRSLAARRGLIVVQLRAR